jgi:hypothetical protein
MLIPEGSARPGMPDMTGGVAWHESAAQSSIRVEQDGQTALSASCPLRHAIDSSSTRLLDAVGVRWAFIGLAEQY